MDKTFGTLGEHAKNFRDQLMDTFTKVIQNYGPEYDLILIAGDLFDRKATPTPIIQNKASQARNPKQGIQNHESKARNAKPRTQIEECKTKKPHPEIQTRKPKPGI